MGVNRGKAKYRQNIPNRVLYEYRILKVYVFHFDDTEY
jgi:hypothetical protein